MPRLRVECLCAVLVAGLVCSDRAMAQRHFGANQVPGMSQMSVHQPWSSNYTPMTPNGFALRQGSGFYSGGSWGGTSIVVGGGFSPFFSFYGGPWGGGWGGYYPPYGPYAVPYAAPWYGPVTLPPLFVPPELMYGPQAIKRFFGFQDQAPPIVPEVVQPGAAAEVIGGGFGVLADEPPKVPKAKRPSTADARTRAQRSIVLGDGHFAKQQYGDANQRDRAAVQSAPDMADGYFRQGFALVTMGRYDLAVRSFKQGLKLDANWAKRGFRLDLLYGDNQLAKSTHLEALANAAAKGPSSDLVFLIGMFLSSDGQTDRARPFLERARELAGADTEHVDAMLRAVAPPAAPQAPEAIAARDMNAALPAPARVNRPVQPPPAKGAAAPAGVDL